MFFDRNLPVGALHQYGESTCTHVPQKNVIFANKQPIVQTIKFTNAYSVVSQQSTCVGRQRVLYVA